MLMNIVIDITDTSVQQIRTINLCDKYLPSATKLRQGNVFTSVCQEFCPQGGHVWWGEGCGRGPCVVGWNAWEWGHVWQGVCMA